jgi:GNAT superfamily N-acetyltransferase
MTSMLDGLTFRLATKRDAARLAPVMVEGFATYRAFAPDSLEPSVDEIGGILEARLETPPVWCQLAEHGADVAGFVSLLPAHDSRRPDPDPGLAHFWMLFVRAPWWGTGLASRLHGAACDAAAARGFTAMRLFTPAGQTRARRFYEREGWTLADGPYPDDELSMDVVEYRRKLPR